MGRIIICPFNSRKAVKKRWRLCEAQRLAKLLLSTINSKFFFFNGLLFCCPVSLVNWIAVYFVPRGTKSWPGIIGSLSIDDALTATIYCPLNFLSNYPLKPLDQSSKILCFLNGSFIQRRWAFFSRHRAKEKNSSLGVQKSENALAHHAPIRCRPAEASKEISHNPPIALRLALSARGQNCEKAVLCVRGRCRAGRSWLF